MCVILNKRFLHQWILDLHPPTLHIEGRLQWVQENYKLPSSRSPDYLVGYFEYSCFKLTLHSL